MHTRRQRRIEDEESRGYLQGLWNVVLRRVVRRILHVLRYHVLLIPKNQPESVQGRKEISNQNPRSLPRVRVAGGGPAPRDRRSFGNSGGIPHRGYLVDHSPDAAGLVLHAAHRFERETKRRRRHGRWKHISETFSIALSNTRSNTTTRQSFARILTGDTAIAPSRIIAPG